MEEEAVLLALLMAGSLAGSTGLLPGVRRLSVKFEVGDLVFMHNVETLGIIIKEKKVDTYINYQVKWFYTMADDFKGYRSAANWYFPHHLGSVNRYLEVR